MNDEELGDSLLELLARLEAAQRAKALRLDNPYVVSLAAVLLPRGAKGMRRRDAIDAVIERRRGKGLPIPIKADDAVQSALQRFCRQSDEFIKRGASEDLALFFWPKGKNAGVWAADRQRVEAWARKKDQSGELPMP